MTNKKLYELMDRLGMVDEEPVCVIEGTPAEVFAKTTAKDLIATMNFVDDLALYNDLETIKKLLVAIIMENKND